LPLNQSFIANLTFSQLENLCFGPFRQKLFVTLEDLDFAMSKMSEMMEMGTAIADLWGDTQRLKKRKQVIQFYKMVLQRAGTSLLKERSYLILKGYL